MTRAKTSLRRPLFAVLAGKAGWLAKLAPEARPEAIERQLRGFETTMAEVAYRYGEMYWGGVDGNWGYAEHMQRIGRTNAAPSAPWPRDAGGRNAASPAGPSLTPGIARVTGAKASVSTAIAL